MMDSELTNDPESLGYAGKTAAEITAIINTPGTASYDPPIPVASDTPVIVKGSDIMDIIIILDGMVDRNGIYGAGLAECLRWMESSDDSWAVCARYCFQAAGTVDIAGSDHRNMIDYMAGVEVDIGSPPVTYTLISEAAMDTILALGMVDMSRARELISRPITEAEIAQVLAA